jgi:hypothetical protein
MDQSIQADISDGKSDGKSWTPRCRSLDLPSSTVTFVKHLFLVLFLGVQRREMEATSRRLLRACLTATGSSA